MISSSISNDTNNMLLVSFGLVCCNLIWIIKGLQATKGDKINSNVLYLDQTDGRAFHFLLTQVGNRSIEVEDLAGSVPTLAQPGMGSYYRTTPKNPTSNVLALRSTNWHLCKQQVGCFRNHFFCKGIMSGQFDIPWPPDSSWDPRDCLH